MKNVQEALVTAKRNIDLVVARRKLLEEKIRFWETLQQKGVGSQPFFYSVVGADGEKGIKLQQTTQNAAGFQGLWNDAIFRGKVTVQNDNSFIWTHIGVCFRSLADTLVTANADDKERVDSASVFSGPRDAVFDSTPDFRIGFVDKSSGRTLFQSERKEMDETQKTKGMIPSDIFAVTRSSKRQAKATPRHGALGLWAMPQEVVLPTSASLDVQLQTGFLLSDVPANFFSNNFRQRVYVTIGGYKVTT